MPVTYTITSQDVASVAPGSRLAVGVTFDWSSQKIQVPSGIDLVNAQWVIDNTRFAEETAIGKARPQIVEGAGRTLIGNDPETALPIFTPTVAIFRDNWKIVTEKAGGSFVVRDVYTAPDAATSIPYDNTVGVFIQYLTSVTGAVTTVNTGGGGSSGITQTQINQIADAVWDEALGDHVAPGSTGKKLSDTSTLTAGEIPAGLSAAQVWSYATRELTGTQAANLAAIPDIPTNPLLATNYTAPDNAGIANTLALAQAFTTGRFQINYSQGKAFQYNRNGTLLQEFNLFDANGNPATSAQTAVDRVPVGEADPAIPVVGLSGLVYWS
jgi:hypothetical protein